MYLAVVNQLIDGKPIVVEEESEVVVSNVFELTAEGSKYLVFEVTVSDVEGTEAKVKLQHSMDGTNFDDVDNGIAAVTLSSDGRFSLGISISNPAFSTLPLRKYCRFVCTTSADEGATIDRILIQQTVE